MFLFEVKRLIWSALEIELFELCFLQPVLGSYPVLNGHSAIPQGWPFNTGSTIYFKLNFNEYCPHKEVKKLTIINN